jgi:hypothetical protein
VGPDITLLRNANATGVLTVSLSLPSLPAALPLFVQHAALEPVAGGIATTASLAVSVR